MVRAGGLARPPARLPGATVRRLREWARANGYKVSERGRIPGEVREAYTAAQA
jgi:hypothetical protein